MTLSSGSEMNRCFWCGNSKLMIDYHDKEWGVPLHNDKMLFEFLILEGAQAGLTWQTILNKRENYRRAFDNFDPNIISRYSFLKPIFVKRSIIIWRVTKDGANQKS